MKLRLLSIISSVAFILLAAPTEALAVIQSLNNQTGQTQTFQNDSNITINSANDIHSLIWNGLLPISRGGTGNDAFKEGSVIFMGQNRFRQDNNNFFWDRVNNRLILGSQSSPGTISTPNATIPDTNGVDLEILSGGGYGNGAGGNIILVAGAGSGGTIEMFTGNEYGGDIKINTGGGSISDGDLYLNGDNIELQGTGAIKIVDIDAGYIAAILNTSLLTTTDQTFTFPNFSGTFSLLEADQTFSGLNKFEASSNSTIYVGSSVKSGCIALGDSDGSGITYITANDGILSASATKPSICQ